MAERKRKVTLKIDIVSDATQLKRDVAELGRGADFAVKVDDRQVDALQRKIKGLEQVNAVVGVEVNDRPLDQLQTKFAGLSDREVSVGVVADSTPVERLQKQFHGLKAPEILLTPRTDERTLVGLNEHFGIKRKDAGELQDYFDANPFAPRAELEDLIRLSNLMSGIAAYSDQTVRVGVDHLVELKNQQDARIAQLLQKLPDRIAEQVKKQLREVRFKTDNGGLMGALMAPIQAAFFGIFQGTGIAIGDRIAAGFSDKFDKLLARFGTQLERYSLPRVGRGMAVGSQLMGYSGVREMRQEAARVGEFFDQFIDPKKIKKRIEGYERAVSEALVDLLVNSKDPQEVARKLIRDLSPITPDDAMRAAARTAGVGARVVSPALRVNKDVKLNQAAQLVDQLANEVRLSEEQLQKAREANAVVVALGGLHRMEGMGGPEVVGPSVQAIAPGAHVVPVANYYRDLPQAQPKTALELVERINSILRPLGMSISPKGNDDALKWLESELLSGAGLDAIITAAIAKAYEKALPDKPVYGVGYSAGAVDMLDAVRLSQLSGGNLKAVGLGGPIPGLVNRPNPNFMPILGSRDHFYRNVFTAAPFQVPNASDQFEKWTGKGLLYPIVGQPLPGTFVAPGAGYEHNLGNYLNNPAAFGKMSAFLPGIMPRKKPDYVTAKGIEFEGGLAAKQWIEETFGEIRDLIEALDAEEANFEQILETLAAINTDIADYTQVKGLKGSTAELRQNLVQTLVKARELLINIAESAQQQARADGTDAAEIDISDERIQEVFDELEKFEQQYQQVIQARKDALSAEMAQPPSPMGLPGGSSVSVSDPVDQVEIPQESSNLAQLNESIQALNLTMLDLIQQLQGIKREPPELVRDKPQQPGGELSTEVKVNRFSQAVEVAGDVVEKATPIVQKFGGVVGGVLGAVGSFAEEKAVGRINRVLQGGDDPWSDQPALPGDAPQAPEKLAELTPRQFGEVARRDTEKVLRTAEQTIDGVKTIVEGTVDLAKKAGQFVQGFRGRKGPAEDVGDATLEPDQWADVEFAEVFDELPGTQQELLETVQTVGQLRAAFQDVAEVAPEVAQLGESVVAGLLNPIRETADAATDARQQIEAALASLDEQKQALSQGAGLQVSGLQGRAGKFAFGDSDLQDLRVALLLVEAISGKIAQSQLQIQQYQYLPEFEQEIAKIRSLQGELGKTRSNALKAIQGWIAPVREAAKAGDDTAAGFLYALENAIPRVEATANRTATQLLLSLKRALGIQSPSREMTRIGLFAMQGLAMGIDPRRAYLIGQQVGVQLLEGVKDELEIASPSRAFFEFGRQSVAGFDQGFDPSRFEGLGRQAAQAVGTGFRTVEEEVKEVAAGVGDIIADLSSTSVVQQTSQEIKGFGEELNRQFPILGRAKNLLGDIAQAAVGVFGVFTLGDALVNLGRTALDTNVKLENLENVLDFASAGQGVEKLAMLNQAADELKVNLFTLIDAYKGFAATATGKPWADQADQMFRGFAEGAAVLQLNTQLQEQFFRALIQMGNKPVISLEELTGQLAEIPGVLQVAARAMNMTDVELVKLAGSGNLLSDELLPKLAAQMSLEASLGLANSTKSTQAAINALNNEVIRSQQVLGQWFELLVDPAIDLATGSLNAFNENQGQARILMLTLAGATSGLLLRALAGLLVELKLNTLALKAFGVAGMTTRAALLSLFKVMIVPAIVLSSWELLNNRINAGAENIKKRQEEIRDRAEAIAKAFRDAADEYERLERVTKRQKEEEERRRQEELKRYQEQQNKFPNNRPIGSTPGFIDEPMWVYDQASAAIFKPKEYKQSKEDEERAESIREYRNELEQIGTIEGSELIRIRRKADIFDRQLAILRAQRDALKLQGKDYSEIEKQIAAVDRARTEELETLNEKNFFLGTVKKKLQEEREELLKTAGLNDEELKAYLGGGEAVRQQLLERSSITDAQRKDLDQINSLLATTEQRLKQINVLSSAAAQASAKFQYNLIVTNAKLADTEALAEINQLEKRLKVKESQASGLPEELAAKRLSRIEGQSYEKQLKNLETFNKRYLQILKSLSVKSRSTLEIALGVPIEQALPGAIAAVRQLAQEGKITLDKDAELALDVQEKILEIERKGWDARLALADKAIEKRQKLYEKESEALERLQRRLESQAQADTAGFQLIQGRIERSIKNLERQTELIKRLQELNRTPPEGLNEQAKKNWEELQKRQEERDRRNEKAALEDELKGFGISPPREVIALQDIGGPTFSSSPSVDPAMAQALNARQQMEQRLAEIKRLSLENELRMERMKLALEEKRETIVARRIQMEAANSKREAADLLRQAQQEYDKAKKSGDKKAISEAKSNLDDAATAFTEANDFFNDASQVVSDLRSIFANLDKAQSDQAKFKFEELDFADQERMRQQRSDRIRAGLSGGSSSSSATFGSSPLAMNSSRVGSGNFAMTAVPSPQLPTYTPPTPQLPAGTQRAIQQQQKLNTDLQNFQTAVVTPLNEIVQMVANLNGQLLGMANRPPTVIDQRTYNTASVEEMGNEIGRLGL